MGFIQETEHAGARYLGENPKARGTYVRAGRTIGYVAAGNPLRPKIIFIHGSPGNWAGYVHFLEDPGLRDAYRIAPDRPGYGESGAGNTERSLAVQADALMGLLDLGNPSAPVILVGHSYGGAVVARMAMSADPRIRSVVIVAGSVDPALEKTKWFQYPADWIPIRWVIPSELRVCNEEIFELKHGLTEALPLWSRISARMSVIQGDLDELVPPANVDFLDKILVRPLSNRVVIVGMNHFIPWRAPDRIWDVLRIEWDHWGLSKWEK
jgi:pimeloyl-ACP methyl ester carboxylesterase